MGPSITTSSPDLSMKIDEEHERFFDFSAYLFRFPYKWVVREFRLAQTLVDEASTDGFQSWVSQDYVHRAPFRYKVPQDIHFYAPRHDERTDQSPIGMMRLTSTP